MDQIDMMNEDELRAELRRLTDQWAYLAKDAENATEFVLCHMYSDIKGILEDMEFEELWNIRRETIGYRCTVSPELYDRIQEVKK